MCIFVLFSSCWIKNPGFYIFFLAPVAAILLMNCVVFALVIRQLIGVSGHAVVNNTTKKKIGIRLNGAIIVILLLGLTYIFAFCAISLANVVFIYLFAIFNSFQGLFLFIFYGLLKKDAYNAWKSSIEIYIRGKSSRSEPSTYGNMYFIMACTTP